MGHTVSVGITVSSQDLNRVKNTERLISQEEWICDNFLLSKQRCPGRNYFS